MRHLHFRLVLSTWVLFAGFALSAQPNPGIASAELNHGKKLFQAHCAACHGPAGTGGRGPNLATKELRRGSTVEALAETIASGVPGSEMGGAWMLTPKEVLEVAVFVQSLSAITPEKLTGSSAGGEKLFNGKGACFTCHITGGKGNANGPELSSIGLRRSASFLRESILDPAAHVPDGFLVVEASPRLAKPIRGVRINEDSFTIQLRDESGKLHSLAKQDLRDLKKLSGESSMPSYKGRLSDTEIEDLVAYLASLHGTRP